jgi:hypothetical protein
MLIVGGVVSTTVFTLKDKELLAVLLLPAASVNLPAATMMLPVVVMLDVGVNVAD